MPEEKTITLYDITELEDSVREKVMDKYRYWNVEDDWWHECYTYISSKRQYKSDFQERAEEFGFNITEIQFSGFGSQGDGLCFNADVDYEEYIKKNKLGHKYATLLNHVKRDGGMAIVKGNDRFGFSMYIEDADKYFDASDDSAKAWRASEKADEQALELIEEILEHATELADDFYRILEKELEYQTSDEQIIDSMQANEIKFTAEGRIF
jgi:hypothetical protein